MYELIRQADQQGASLSAMARAVGVSRQSVQKLMAKIR
jgi:biotin operon repressor